MTQPAPTPGEGDMWAEIIRRLPGGRLRAVCIARRAFGIAKYGTPLQRENGRNYTHDALEEALDLAVYLRQDRRWLLSWWALAVAWWLLRRIDE